MEFVDNCCEIELTEVERESLGLDSTSVLLELRPETGLYGVFYSAKGMQWDVWSDTAEDHEAQKISYAMRDPTVAVRTLLGRRWRPDFNYDPDEEDA